MKLVVGLGNPGVAYQNTRHNAGFLVAEELQKIKLPTDVVVRKSNVFMNESGSFVESLYTKYHIPNTSLFIIHDDLDLLIGSYKIQFGRGPKDHNGLKSINDKLGTSSYWHVRVGVDNRPFDNRPLGDEFVLQNFTDEERQILDKVIKELCKKLATSFKNIN
jgi:PTH1 family peptidyl-tRNA hydrolase